MVSYATVIEQEAEFETTAYHPIESELGSVIDIDNFNFWYGQKQALFNNTLKIQKELRHRPDRPFGMREIHAPSFVQPYERPDRRHSPRWDHCD